MKTLQIALFIFILSAISSAYGGHCGTDHGADKVRVADKDHKDHEDHEDHEDHDKEKSDSDHEAHEGHDH
jgi:zinc transport system substrate-binding protein